MRRLSLLITGVVFFVSSCEDPPPPDNAGALTSKVELAAGNVWLVKQEGRERLITGAMLAEKATLSVDDGGRALVRLDSGAGTFLRGGTTITIDEEVVRLKQGELWADIPAGETEMARFDAGKVSVSASDAGLDIAFDGKSVTVYVARGLAVVTGPGGRAEVQSGERVKVAGTSALKVTPVAFWEDWTGGMADRTTAAGIGGKGSGHIYGIDRSRPGAPPSELQITSQSVRIGIRDGIAHTVVDQRFFNPGSAPLEGWYWFTVPEGASVDRFALEVNGQLVEGEMVERKQAAAAYEAAVQNAFDPALLEWVDGRTFRARIFPIPGAGERRVVLSYFELLPMSDGVYRYTYPMASSGDTTIQEFSLSVDLGETGQLLDIRTLQDAKVEKDKTKISMRRSGFQPKADFLLELSPVEEDDIEPLRVMRYSPGGEAADYVMVRYSPEVAWDTLKKVPGDVVVVLDTSAGGDDSDRQIRADAVEAILRALSKGDRFAVMATDLAPRVVFPQKGLADATEKNVSTAVEKLSEIPSAGATDIGEMFSSALNLLHDAKQPAVVYVGDGLATVGETSSNALDTRLRRALGGSRARLFTIAVGADANVSLLERLARTGGGRSFAITRSEQTVQEALHFVGMLKTPTITDLVIDAGKGLDQVFTTQSGKLSKGDEMILVARTHHALPEAIAVKGRLGDQPINKTYHPGVETGGKLGYIPLIWARQYLSKLMGDGTEENRGRIISLGLNYALMTPFSSFLVLESDQAYLNQGIQRRHRYRFSKHQDGESPRTLAAREVVWSVPLGLFGCSESREPEPAAQLETMTKEMGDMGAGKRHKPASQPPGANVSGQMGRMKTEEGVMPSSPAEAEQKVAAPAPASSAARSARRRSTGGRVNALDDLLGGASDKKGAMGTRHGRSGGGMVGVEKEDGEMAAPADRDEVAQIAIPGFNANAPKQGKIFKQGVCSDASRRSLEQRRILWIRRLARVTDPAGFHGLFFEAGEKCELPRWKDRKVMLDLIESRMRTPQQVRGLLGAFNGNVRIQKYLRQTILRRALDPEMAMGLHFAGMPDWASVNAGLAAIADPRMRLRALRDIVAKHPGDPKGRELLIALLAELGDTDEAIREASRLRRDGLASPPVMETLCDLQAGVGRVVEAKRTCSELVEFNADDPAARQRLGDIFLRHGWYEAAYRQYASLVTMIDESPFALLRLAAAAAGMGKVDEALRIERKVASGNGEPGPADPRRFARLHSAARLASMLLKAREEKNESMAKAVERSLKQTQVFGAESTIAILVWEDLQAALELMPKVGQEVFAVSEMVVSNDTGLVMIDMGRAPPEALRLFVNATDGAARRQVPFTLLTIAWDGRTFSINEKRDSAVPEKKVARKHSNGVEVSESQTASAASAAASPG